MNIQSKTTKTVKVTKAHTLHLELSEEEVQGLYDALNLATSRYFAGSTLPCDIRIELVKLGAEGRYFREPT